MAIFPPGPPIRADDWAGWLELLESIGLDTKPLRDQARERKTYAEELRDAREAQKWADHIHRERLTYYRSPEGKARDNAADNDRCGEILVWTDEQHARARYIAETGRFPPPGWKP